MRAELSVSAFVLSLVVATAFAGELRINQIQFVGSHNSYKLPMAAKHFSDLWARKPEVAESLDYGHAPLAEQLELGMRKLELDLFADEGFPVGHVQEIDMRSSCPDLTSCLSEIILWSEQNPRHVPIWISFNLKDQFIEGLPAPTKFERATLTQLDDLLNQTFGARLIRPDEVVGRSWPTLDSAAGKFLLVLDESGEKRDWYAHSWRDRPMFMNVAEDHPGAAVMIVNDPTAQRAEIERLVRAGFMVRTRADADTREARANDTRRRDDAFASGAHAISTDYYRPFENGYQVRLEGVVRCNPVTAPPDCGFREGD